MEMIKLVCKYLIENEKSALGYYCGTTQVCIHITETTFVCPIIEYAREYEAGKFRKVVLSKTVLEPNPK
jgi:hypothetical protein